MRYRITHRTNYSYGSPVHESFNEIRLQPVSDGTQTCLGFDLVISPPTTVITYRDYYGNAVHDFGVPYLHDHLTIDATSDVITFAAAEEPLTGPRDSEQDTSPRLVSLVTDAVLADEYAEYLGSSAYVTLDPAVEELARSLVAMAPNTAAYAFMLRIGEYIHRRFTYQVGVTTVQSRVAEVIAGGKGVCQDFAHLFIAVCRGVGVPARYVSGYLGDVTESEASHAWAEAYIPPYGWVSIDPTVGGPCTGRHVKVGVGRDYADVAILRGTYRGGAEAALTVRVSGTTLNDTQGLAGARGLGTVAGRGTLIQYQTLGAMQQFQRSGAMATMTQTMGDMTQTLGSFPSAMRGQRDEEDIPRQQPQQQQQQQQQQQHEG